ncbi:superoxide dismutase [uncultured Ferrovibrio sp.]|jgi:Fe-Mn family superoxide dismutase|uniref:superoxide dismutase n=1 Tax=uncultured Ferrovibrio sp. TaxID=1576913 RepID=UPI00260C8CC6|nr:superoxide dismutase [uncultured Ferrovibrio sp.]
MSAPFQLKPLPFAEDALSPVINAQTLGFHHGKHHATYVNTLNKLLENDPLKDSSLEEIVKAAHGKPEKQALFNNAGQVWNHDFYWNSLRPNGGGKPTGKIGDLIKDSFGDYDKFKSEFANAAVTQFGSGWAWLCAEGNKLTIRKTPNAESPLHMPGVKALLTIDVWEHAYYLDYQNRRVDYANAVIDKLLNWEFAEKNLG